VASSVYAQRLPFVFLVNIATALDSFQRNLPMSILSLLRTEKFKLCASDPLLDGLVEELLAKPPNGVRMDGGSLNELILQYRNYNMSIHSFVNGIKVSLLGEGVLHSTYKKFVEQFGKMIQYNTSPLSILADYDPESKDYEEIIDELEHHDLELLRFQPSFQK
jgi:hypothetical protein